MKKRASDLNLGHRYATKSRHGSLRAARYTGVFLVGSLVLSLLTPAVEPASAGVSQDAEVVSDNKSSDQIEEDQLNVETNLESEVIRESSTITMGGTHVLNLQPDVQPHNMDADCVFLRTPWAQLTNNDTGESIWGSTQGTMYETWFSDTNIRYPGGDFTLTLYDKNSDNATCINRSELRNAVRPYRTFRDRADNIGVTLLTGTAAHGGVNKLC